MIRELSVEAKLPDEVMLLLKKIHQYYPIGLPSFNEHYPGYKTLLQIVELKIKDLQQNKRPDNWSGLLRDMSTFYPAQFEIRDNLYRQFPNYALTIELFNDFYNDVQTIYTLNLKISLLTNHFTFYYEEVTTFKHHISRHIPVTIKILSSTNNKADPESIYAKKLIELVNHHFAAYNYIDHKLLLTRIIKGGVPYSVDRESTKDYPIYFYLFDNDLITGDYKVV